MKLLTIIITLALSTSAIGASYIRLGRQGTRHVLINPQGNAMFFHGVNHIESDGAGTMETLVKNKLTGLGFNSFGYGCPDNLKNDKPYCEGWNDLVPCSEYNTTNFSYVDVFDPTVTSAIMAEVASRCRALKFDTNFIGYMWTDQPLWKLQNSKNTNWVEYIRQLGSTAPGKIAYVNFLKTRYSTIAAFNSTYGTNFSAWTAVKSYGFANVPSTTAVVNDDKAFLRMIAHNYFDMMYSAVVSVDTNHLIFGDRINFSTIIPEVVEEMSPYVDAFAIQPPYEGGFPKAQYDNLYRMGGNKPILICDFAIRFKDGTKPIQGATLVANDDIAGQQYTQYIHDAIHTTNYIVGSMYCNMIDKDLGAKIKQGLYVDRTMTDRPNLQRHIRALDISIP